MRTWLDLLLPPLDAGEISELADGGIEGAAHGDPQLRLILAADDERLAAGHAQIDLDVERSASPVVLAGSLHEDGAPLQRWKEVLQVRGRSEERRVGKECRSRWSQDN